MPQLSLLLKPQSQIKEKLSSFLTFNKEVASATFFNQTILFCNRIYKYENNDKRLTLKSFGVLNLAIVLATIVIYAFQLGATYINRFLSTSYEKTTLFYSLVFTIVFLLGILEFLILYISRINNLSLKAMTFLVKEGYKPRFITAISTVFITSLISMLMGLSLGGEAPSLYLSGASFV